MAQKRKLIAMTVYVTAPADMTAQAARREVRTLINEGTGWAVNAGDPDGVRARRVGPVSGTLYNRKAKGLTR